MDLKLVVQNQNKIFEMLKNSYKNDRLSHAYLFYGVKGVGKKAMAYALACILNCENDVCFECDTCRSIIEGNHMNVDYIGISENKTMISKEQILELQSEFSMTSLLDGTRVYIVDGIDTASAAAQNSLLKFIEEPVNNTPTIGIFIAEELSNVVSTIISRCSLIHFNELPIDFMIDTLISEGVDEFDASLAALLSNNIDEVREIVSGVDFMKAKELFLEFINIKKAKDGVLYYISNSQFFSDNKNLEMLFKWLIRFTEDAILLSKTEEGLLLKGLYDKIKSYKEANKASLKNKLEMLLDLYSRLRYNVTAKNVFHELVTKIV
ncbi:MAG: hypothetical protein J6R47_02190 [Acholeplasmatales bacterium]|nr:hypothetical protein [Acholeplasmatales bacterium]